jgi:alanyl-tRNA synthetase
VTERLYYHDSFLREFDARVIACEPEGDRWKIELDRTAFYPTSGGQPHDTGKLGDATIVEVADAENHKVVHYASAAVALGPVRGHIDWTRRLDHMQQHTGQHLLSAAFIELFQFSTVSFHLGAESSTIDLEAPSLSTAQLGEAEKRTNQIIFEDRLVTIRFGTAEELAEAGIRKKVEREGILRAIEVEGFDRQPCGGTHLARTGQAGLLLLRKLERRRESWRVEFVCGFRALAAARSDYATLGTVAEQLSCALLDVPVAVQRMAEERRAQHAAVKRLEDSLAEHEALALIAASKSNATGGARTIVAAIDNASAAYLALVAAKVAAQAKAVVVLASRSTGHVVLAQSKGGAGDMGSLLRGVLSEFGGKGGGARDFAQGSLPETTRIDPFLARVCTAIA